MLPLSLLRTAVGHPMLVELKNGETYNGHLVACDSWMNLHLREVICTSRDGTRFWQIRECFVRGNTIKYLRVPDEVLEKVKEDESASRKDKSLSGSSRGGRGNMGRGRGGPGRGSGGRGRGRGGEGGRGRGRGGEGVGGGRGRGRGRGGS
eukprot:gb/GEZN01019965.1/.p1 GENE.gb/GEZN01019965.1/~~gb/GEZN01019965.1/.p1  ORF type:complete len:150 (-),score=14.63 gb/GEZN01019965.1/:180-629(-)